MEQVVSEFQFSTPQLPQLFLGLCLSNGDNKRKREPSSEDGCRTKCDDRTWGGVGLKARGG